MISSAFEGWPLTLIEAQQCGCVPLAFDSFASLKDIITREDNGFIIPNNDIPAYIQQIKQLMTDDKLRKSMAANAIESSKRFTIDTIIKEWIKLMEE